MEEATFVVVGGGIAGVSCVEGLSFFAPEEKIILISSSSLIKKINNVIPYSKMTFSFKVEEEDYSNLNSSNPLLTIINSTVCHVNINDKIIQIENGKLIKYNKLCLCTGAKAHIIADNNPYVLGIRDTESVEKFSEKVSKARKLVVIGNGGIATEMVHELKNIEIVWVIKDSNISATFFDAGASEFFQDKLLKDNCNSESSNEETKIYKRFKYTLNQTENDKCHSESKNSIGAALGPDWCGSIKMKGLTSESIKVNVEYNCQVKRIIELNEISENFDKKWPVYIELTNGKIIGCDLIISATGVTPNTDISGLESIVRGDDGGFLVNWKMETSVKDIYAAGDVCTAGWELADHWFQMRLWTQALQMGRYVANSIVSTYKNELYYQDFSFELFTHVTSFFGYKIVLLGLYNGQKLENDYEIILRITKNVEYIKLILKNDKLQGAILIGDTDLEEMCENLILNQLDLSIYGEDLLNPNIDIEDYFD